MAFEYCLIWYLGLKILLEVCSRNDTNCTCMEILFGRSMT